MIRKIAGLVLLLIAYASTAQQKQDKPFIIIDGKDTITKNEFIRIYKKNNSISSENSKSVEDYLDLFVNFRLKVKEAEDQGYDTTQSFKREYNVYKNQLVKPYLVDSIKLEELLKEAYNRMKTDVRASQIMVLMPKDPTPEDTLKAYKKIWKAYNELKKGKDFAEVAKKFSESKFTAARGGDMGWFNVLRYPYKFESVAYNTPLGKFSKPFRTRSAYHIVKVTGRRPNRGRVQVAHILVAVPLYSNDKTVEKAKAKIDSIYNLLQNGADFAELAKKLSDDKGSAYQGGLLNWFGTGDMVEPFEKAAFSLKNVGDISKPVRTPIGFHILKLINVAPIKSYEEMKPGLLTQLKKSDRYQLITKSKIEKLKKEYNFSYYKKALAAFYKAAGDSIMYGKPDKVKLAKLNKTLFTLDGKEFSQQEFAKYLIEKSKKHSLRRKEEENEKKIPVKFYINEEFNKFADNFVRNYEINKLPQKDTEYKFVLKEYHDGILLFDIMDDMVWKKAVKDTAGLKKFYEEHKNNYLYPVRYEVAKFKVNNKKAEKKLLKLITKNTKTDYTPEELADKINTKYKNAVSIEYQGLFEKGKKTEIDEALTKSNGKIPYVYQPKENEIVYLKNKVAPTPKPLKEVKGLVVSDYQNYLEAQWIKELKKKHKVFIDKNVLNEIKKELNQ